ncbi:MAG: hypothetical protein IID45_08515 [Planctomycetes bacterium]|nr:hypothetical protein [Planctomycetota bacterium]
MRRGHLWQQTVERTSTVLNRMQPDDQVQILVFSRDVKTIVSTQEWSSWKPSVRRRSAFERIERIKPGWGDTDLGLALVQSLEKYTFPSTSAASSARNRATQIVLITDFQRGSRVDALRKCAWPKKTIVRVHRVEARNPTNAGVQIVGGRGRARVREKQSESIRVRVSNSRDSAGEHFRLRWGTGPKTGTVASGSRNSIDVFVERGRSRTVRIPLKTTPGGETRIELSGDDHKFDNTVFLAHSKRRVLEVLFFSDETGKDADSLRFFLERAFLTTRDLKIDFRVRPASSSMVVPRDLAMAVLDATPSNQLSASLGKYVEGGGTLLCVPRSAADLQSLGAVLGDADLTATEADVAGESILSDIDFSHPLFAVFRDARFADFTKIRFWHHRKLSEASLPPHRILAKFDDGDPAIVEIRRGRGRIILLTSSWRPVDSQLARSSKFVPLLFGLLELSSNPSSFKRRLSIGDPIRVTPAAAETVPKQRLLVKSPDGGSVRLAAGQTSFDETVVPGVYTISSPRTSSKHAVNVAAAESRTSPMSLDELESLGVTVVDGNRESGWRPPNSSSTAGTKELAASELAVVALEQRQQIWRWLVVVAIGVLFLETWLARKKPRLATQLVETQR